MPITLICPGCQTRLTVGDDRAGTTFRCMLCATAISVPVVEPDEPASQIRFACPDCGKRLKAPADAIGRPGRCSCGASFVVPGAGTEPRSEPTPAPQPAIPSCEVADEPEPDDEPEPLYRPQRRRKRGGVNWLGVTMVGGLGLLALIAGVGLTAKLRGPVPKTAPSVSQHSRSETRPSAAACAP